MVYKELIVWVEGEDDRKFFERVLNPLFGKKYDIIKILIYSGGQYKSRKGKERIIKFINSINKMNQKRKSIHNYIFVSDINSSSSILSKKNAIKRIITNIDEDKIAIVIKEIESWYLAGLNKTVCKEIGIKITRNYNDTETINKEKFYQLMPSQHEKVPLLLEILNNYSISLAKKRNNSFDYFLKTFT